MRVAFRADPTGAIGHRSGERSLPLSGVLHTRAPWRLFSTVTLFVLLNLLAIEIEHEEAKRR